VKTVVPQATIRLFDVRRPRLWLALRVEKLANVGTNINIGGHAVISKRVLKAHIASQMAGRIHIVTVK
jgi:hypothetical protein